MAINKIHPGYSIPAHGSLIFPRKLTRRVNGTVIVPLFQLPDDQLIF